MPRWSVTPAKSYKLRKKVFRGVFKGFLQIQYTFSPFAVTMENAGATVDGSIRSYMLDPRRK